MKLAPHSGTRQWNILVPCLLVPSFLTLVGNACVKKEAMLESAQKTDVVVATPVAPGQLGLTADTSTARPSSAPLPFESRLASMLSDVAGSYGCEGSFRTAFEEAAKAQEKALSLESARLQSRGAAERELWRQARLAAVRSFSRSEDIAPSPEGTEEAEGADASDAGEGSSAQLLQGSAQKLQNAPWTDDAARCKSLGTLFASTAHLADLARRTQTTPPPRQEGKAPPSLCEAVTPARFGSLAAILSCRLQAKGGHSDTFVREALTRTGSLAPSCGEGYAIACAQIVRSRLYESPTPECSALATQQETLTLLQAWGCKTPL